AFPGLALGSLFAAAQGEDAPPAQPEYLALTHQVRTAYYATAPDDLGAAMRAAVADFCKSASDSDRTAAAWLCDGTPLGFLREVNVFGDESRNGRACRAAVLQSRIRLFLDDMYGSVADCVPVRSNPETGAHYLTAGDLVETGEDEESQPYGEYLAYTTGCINCHHQTHRSVINAPQLLIVRSYALPEFRKLLKTGVTKTGRDLVAEASVMGIVAKEQFSHFSDEDVNALFDFLTTDWTAARAREEEQKIPVLFKPLIDKGELPPP
ncbi:MAG TPA: hypothetical protein VLD67_22300, partial [Vicinamibacterales bacterium]|nr:hypothetical protein [Vicinamibacterales bacterium]